MRNVLSNKRGAIELTHSGITATAVGAVVVAFGLITFFQTIGSMV